jgi:hypothetical protein
MDKKDLMYMGAALVLVLVIALVIKPMVTGQALATGIATPTTQPTITPIRTQPGSGLVPDMANTPVVTPTLPPTPIATWNPNVTQTLGFVNPSSYGVSLNQTMPGGTRINDIGLDTNMTTFATIQSDTGSSGTTGIMYIPFPYWELVYTVNPSTPPSPEKIALEPTKGVGLSYSGVSGSYSTATPQFTVQVMDGDDPNRIVRTFSPPGGIDLNLWTGVKQAVSENSALKTNQKQVVASETAAVDPRPWTEKFFEGQRHYYFIITAQALDSYTMKIQIPNRYIGQY